MLMLANLLLPEDWSIEAEKDDSHAKVAGNNETAVPSGKFTIPDKSAVTAPALRMMLAERRSVVLSSVQPAQAFNLSCFKPTAITRSIVPASASSRLRFLLLASLKLGGLGDSPSCSYLEYVCPCPCPCSAQLESGCPPACTAVSGEKKGRGHMHLAAIMPLPSRVLR